MALTAVVLAGGARDQVCEQYPDVPNKAFIPIDGETLVARTITALRSSAHIGRIIAVAPASAHGQAALAGADDRRADGARIAESMRSGLRGLPQDRPVIVAASDLPALSRAAVDEFIGLARARGAAATYSCVERSVHERSYPGVPHTWARMRDGSYCGGGLVALVPAMFPKLERFLDRLGSARKNPLALASIFGADVLVRYAARALSIEDAEKRASELLEAPVAAAVCSHAEIAINVDRAQDIALVSRYVHR